MVGLSASDAELLSLLPLPGYQHNQSFGFFKRYYAQHHPTWMFGLLKLVSSRYSHFASQAISQSFKQEEQKFTDLNRKSGVDFFEHLNGEANYSKLVRGWLLPMCWSCKPSASSPSSPAAPRTSDSVPVSPSNFNCWYFVVTSEAVQSHSIHSHNWCHVAIEREKTFIGENKAIIWNLEKRSANCGKGFHCPQANAQNI